MCMVVSSQGERPGAPGLVCCGDGVSREERFVQGLSGHVHLNQDGARAGQCIAQRLVQQGGVAHTHSLAALATGEREEVEIRQVGAFELVAFVEAEGGGKLLQRRVAAVLEDDEGDGQLQLRRTPQGLDGVHRRAVAQQADHLLVGFGQRNAYGGRHALAQAAAALGVEGFALHNGQEGVHGCARAGRGCGKARGGGAGRASRSSTPSRMPPTAEVPSGVQAAVPGSSISCTSCAPGGTCGPKPSTWYVNAAAPSANTRSCPPSSATIFSRMAGSTPANRRWTCGKPQRPDMGAIHTAALCRSASASTPSQARSRSTAAPTTNTGRCAPSSASPMACSTRGSGRDSVLTVRACNGSQGLSQSSAGMDTSTGPRGCCMAM